MAVPELRTSEGTQAILDERSYNDADTNRHQERFGGVETAFHGASKHWNEEGKQMRHGPHYNLKRCPLAEAPIPTCRRESEHLEPPQPM